MTRHLAGGRLASPKAIANDSGGGGLVGVHTDTPVRGILRRCPLRAPWRCLGKSTLDGELNESDA